MNKMVSRMERRKMEKEAAKKAVNVKIRKVTAGSMIAATVAGFCTTSVAGNSKTTAVTAAPKAAITTTVNAVEKEISNNIVATTTEVVKAEEVVAPVATTIETVVNAVEESEVVNNEVLAEFLAEVVAPVQSNVVLTEATNNEVVAEATENEGVKHDEAIKMIDQKCMHIGFESYCGSDSIAVNQFLMGRDYVRDEYQPNDAGYEISEWFWQYFGTEAENHELKYDIRYSIAPGTAKFDITEDGKFAVVMNREDIQITVESDQDHSLEASIRGGVSQETREWLTSEQYMACMPFIGKIIGLQEEQILANARNSNSLVETVKLNIAKEFKLVTGYDVEVVVK